MSKGNSKFILSYDEVMNSKGLENLLSKSHQLFKAASSLSDTVGTLEQWLDGVQNNAAKTKERLDLRKLIEQGEKIIIINSNSTDDNKDLSSIKEKLINKKLQSIGISTNDISIVQAESIHEGLKQVAEKSHDEQKFIFANINNIGEFGLIPSKYEEKFQTLSNNDFDLDKRIESSINKNHVNKKEKEQEEKKLATEEKIPSHLKRAVNKIRRTVGSVIKKTGKVIGKDNVIGKHVTKVGKAVKGKSQDHKGRS